jgi:hypothetical protein
MRSGVLGTRSGMSRKSVSARKGKLWPKDSILRPEVGFRDQTKRVLTTPSVRGQYCCETVIFELRTTGISMGLYILRTIREDK